MAARVNVRFLLVLIIVLGAVLGGVGAYFILQEQTAEDHMAKAEELTAAGALKPALQQLEAAIGKDPENRALLRQLADLHQRIKPRSRSEAFELLPNVMALANHYSVYFPEDADGHRRAIATQRAAIRTMPALQAPGFWDLSNEAAERLMELADDPDAVAEGMAIHGLWLAAPSRGVDLRADRTTDQRAEGRELLRTALEDRPADDHLRAAYLETLRGRLVLQLDDNASDRLVDEAITALIEGLDDAEAALAAQPDDVSGTAIRTRTAISNAWRQIAMARDRAARTARSTGRGVEEAQKQYAEALDRFLLATRELRSVAERWAGEADIVPGRDEPLEGGVSDDEYLRVVAEAMQQITLLSMLGTEYSGVALAEQVMARPEVASTTRAHSIELAALSTPARTASGADAATRAEAVEAMAGAVDRTLALEPQPMGLDAVLSDTLRRRARAAAVEAELFAWELAEDDAARARQLASMQQRQQDLEQEIRDSGSEPDEVADGLYGRGLVAFARGDTTAAASFFERLVAIDSTSLDSFQQAVSLRLLGRMLEEEGSLVRAAQSYRRLLETSPNDIQTITRLAGVELRRGRPADAAALTDRLAQLVGETPQVETLRRAVAVARGEESDDPVANAIARMRTFEEAGQVDEAMAVAEELVSSPPGSERANVHAIVGDLAMRAGLRDRAIAAFQRAAELAPENPGYAARLTMMSIDDPIEQSIEMAESAIDDPAERAVRLADAFETRVRAIDARLAATDDPEVRDEFEAERARFEEAMRTQVAAARDTIGPGSSARAVTLWMERLLRLASETGDWTEAEDFLAAVRTDDLDRAGGSFAEGQFMLARAGASEGAERQAFYEQAAAALEEAESLLPFSDGVGRRLGVAQRELGRLDEAAEAFAGAVANAPADAGLSLEYVRLLVQRGELALASDVAGAALRLSPDDVPLREFRLGLELRRGNEGVVLLERRRLHDRSPSDIDNALRYAYLLLNTMPAYATMVDDEGRPVLTPGEWARLGPGGQQSRLELVRRNWIDEARQIIADVDGRGDMSNPGVALALDLLRAMAAEASGDGDGAVAILRAASDAADGEMLQPTIAAAAALLMEFRRVRDAYDLLLAQQARFGEVADPMLAWTTSQVLQEAGRPDLAFPQLRAARAAADGEPFTVYIPRFSELRVNAVEQSPATVTRQLVRLLLAAGDPDDARRLWEEAALPESRANDFIELSILAREADAARFTGEGDADAIDARFESLATRLTSDQPEDPEIWGLRIERLLQRNLVEGRVELLDQAQALLEEGRQSVPDPTVLAPANLRVLSARGNTGALARELEGQLEERPADPSTRANLVSAYETLGRLEDAERVLRDGIDLAGMSERSLAWRMQLARLLVAQEKYEQATAAYAQASAIAGEDNLALLRQSLLARLAGDSPQYRQVAEILRTRDEDMTTEPLLRAIFARCLMQLGRDAPAEEQFIQSLAQIRAGIAGRSVRLSDTGEWVQQVLEGRDDPLTAGEARVRRLAGGELDPWMLLILGQKWARGDEADPQRAVELMEQAIARVEEGDAAPGQRSLIRKILGGVLVEQDRAEEALEVFELALAETPRDADLLNNTAFLQATLVGDAEGALPRALRAVARQPDNWAFLDTAGKICSLLERWDDAEAYLRRSIAARDDARNTLHLAEVLAATDRRDEALRQLERASELLEPDDEETRAEINQLADELAGG